LRWRGAADASLKLPCPNLNTDHAPLIHLYRRARTLPGIKKTRIGSGVRYDLAVESPEYVKELVTHHVGGYLEIDRKHVERGNRRPKFNINPGSPTGRGKRRGSGRA
jgi:radical SAM superfamily enzyme YgiQ (UPF0313 family)